MAVRSAITNGNWSSTATWDNGALLGIPTSADLVFSNTFTVNIDQNVDVNWLANSGPYTGIGVSVNQPEIVPVMTSNLAPSGICSASANSATAWQAFDNTGSTTWTGVGTTGWLRYQTTTANIARSYHMFVGAATTGTPNSWTFEGSNDGSSWTILDTRTGILQSIQAWASYIPTTTGSFTYYRLNVTAINGGTNVTIYEFRPSLYNPAAVGGTFNLNTPGVGVTSGNASQGVSNLFTVTNSTGTVSLNIGSNVATVSAQTSITYSGNGNFIFTFPNMIANNAALSCTYLNKTGSGTLTANGNIYSTGAPGGQTIRAIVSTLGNVIVNGNVLGSPVTTVNGTNRTLDISGGSLTINGNVIPTLVPPATSSVANCPVFFSGTTFTLNGNTLGGDGFCIVSSGTVNINGTLNCGLSVYANGAITINVVGDVYAGVLTPAISTALFPVSVVNLTGNMYNTLGRNAIFSANLFISNSTTSLWRIFTGGGTTKTLYSADTSPNNPATSNVRSGITYGPGLSLTGTMVVLSAANTRKGVATDNTVGTAELTSSDIINGINASSDPLAVRLRNILTDKAAGSLISQYKDS